MVADLDPIRAYACNNPGCYQSFNTEKEVKEHKVDEPDHFYCKKCDVDCEDWAALTQHKVDLMSLFFDQREANKARSSPKHIVCEFCGMDFKSMGGRLLHRERHHQAEQNIKCPGCDQLFIRAGAMVGHLENDECRSIRAYQFQANIQQKFIRNEIMKRPDIFTQNLQINAASAALPAKPGAIEHFSSTPTGTETEGGVAVPLLEREEEEQKGGDEPLEAKIASINLDGDTVQLTRKNFEAWPRLPGQAGSKGSDYVRHQLIGSPQPSLFGTGKSASQFASEITTRRGSKKVQTEHSASIIDSGTAEEGRFANTDDEDDTGSVCTAKAESVLGRPAAWITENTSRALFGHADATPAASDHIKSILKKREEDAERPRDLLNAHWWDPNSEEYTPEAFYDQGLQMYCCPFANVSCNTEPVATADEIEIHFQLSHIRRQFRCPACLHLFKTAQGMVSHMESAGKCQIRKSKEFKKVLDEITGGFIKAKRLPQPAVYNADKALVKSGQVMNGVMGTAYTAKMPFW